MLPFSSWLCLHAALPGYARPSQPLLFPLMWRMPFLTCHALPNSPLPVGRLTEPALPFQRSPDYGLLWSKCQSFSGTAPVWGPDCGGSRNRLGRRRLLVLSAESGFLFLEGLLREKGGCGAGSLRHQGLSAWAVAGLITLKGSSAFMEVTGANTGCCRLLC